MFAERHKETSMSDTKDKNSRGILVDFRSGSEVGESVSEDEEKSKDEFEEEGSGFK